ncbi:MAG: hypothetical protein EPO32_14715 [Anaerolineae bacterium]|nr:MAG: hypothetical protein EPO32_14715 [Anaerolineae bacterium]
MAPKLCVVRGCLHWDGKRSIDDLECRRCGKSQSVSEYRVSSGGNPFKPRTYRERVCRTCQNKARRARWWERRAEQLEQRSAEALEISERLNANEADCRQWKAVIG